MAPFSPFLPTTSNVPEEEDRLGIFLIDRLAVHADVINDKKIGVYLQEAESQNGEKWWYADTKVTRNGAQVIAYIPSLPNTGVMTLTLTSNPAFPIQDIDPDFRATLVMGTASKPCSAKGAGDGVYFSFFSEGDSRISFTMSDIAITITTTTDLSAYSAFIIIHYLRRGS
jgi:hypothetical protein